MDPNLESQLDELERRETATDGRFTTDGQTDMELQRHNQMDCKKLLRGRLNPEERSHSLYIYPLVLKR